MVRWPQSPGWAYGNQRAFMCFSAPASFVAGASLSAMGVVTVKRTKDKFEVPFAIIPLVFGIQQFIEGGLWLVPGGLFNTILTYGFVFFAYIFWPIWIPFSIMILEHDKVRRKILVFFLGIGLVVGLAQFYNVLTLPVTSRVVLNSIVYAVPNAFAYQMMFLYLMATCLSCAFSSHRIVKVFGLCLFISLFIAYQFYTASCFSVWCFFAAILSMLVALHFHLRLPPVKSLKVPQVRMPKVNLPKLQLPKMPKIKK